MEDKACKRPQSINSIFLLPQCATFLLKNYSVPKKFAMARTLPPARETRALPNHPRASHCNPRFHKTPIAHHLSRFVSICGAAGRGGGVGRGLGVARGLAVGVGLGVGVGLPEAVAVAVAVGLAVAVAVGVDVAVAVAVAVAVGVTVAVGLAVGVGVGVPAGSLNA